MYLIGGLRTMDGAEVDFVIDNITEVIPIEVKYSDLKASTISRSFRNFIEKYKPKKAVVVNLSYSDEITIEETRVSIIPYYLLATFIE